MRMRVADGLGTDSGVSIRRCTRTIRTYLLAVIGLGGLLTVDPTETQGTIQGLGVGDRLQPGTLLEKEQPDSTRAVMVHRQPGFELA